MFKYNIISKPNFTINTDILDKIFNKVSEKVEISQKWELNIVFVKDEEIRELNKNYRQIDKVTDVLSFHYFDNFSYCKNNEIVWEIILCESKIFSQWVEFWLWEEKEFYKLVIHSILHILWFDHENDEDYDEMNNYEEIIWEEIL